MQFVRDRRRIIGVVGLVVIMAVAIGVGTFVSVARAQSEPGELQEGGHLLDQAGITVAVSSSTGLTTTESGGTASFDVVLNSQPTADVTFNVTSSDPTEGTVSVGSVTFTTSNWNTAQTVTVTGVDDAEVDGDTAYTIITGAATSSDAAYNGLNAADVSASRHA